MVLTAAQCPPWPVTVCFLSDAPLLIPWLYYFFHDCYRLFKGNTLDDFCFYPILCAPWHPLQFMVFYLILFFLPAF